MPDNVVDIVYRVSFPGKDQMTDFIARQREMNDTVSTSKTKTDEAAKSQENHKNILQQAHQAARQLHRELYVGAAIIGLVTVALTSMAKGSESAQMGLETLTGWLNQAGGAAGNFIAKWVAVAGAMSGGANFGSAMKIADAQTNAAKSLDTQVKLLSMEAQTLKFKGDEMGALVAKQQAEQTALKKDGLTQRYYILKDALDREQAAETEAFRLSELGLKSHNQIAADFKRNLVGNAFQGSTQSVLEKTLSGEHQTAGDAAKTFQQGIARAISEALSQSIFTTMFQGGNFFDNLKNLFTGNSPQVQAAKRAASASEALLKKDDEILGVLRQIAECTCSTARSVSGGFSATIEPPKTSGLAKAKAITDLIGSAAGAAGMFSGFGGGGGQTGGGNPNLDLLPSGYSVEPTFPSGGEVPIMAQPGEIVMRRSVAQQNKEMLLGMNAGMKPSRGGGGSVFIIKANDAASFTDMLSSPSSRAALEIQIMRAIMANGNLRDVMRRFA